MANSDAFDTASFNQMVDMWKQGQDAFFKAQKEAVDGFNRSLGAKPVPGLPPLGTAESAQAWQVFINSWAPAWNPSSMMGQTPAGASFGQTNDAFFAMLDPSNWTHHAPEQLRIILQSVAQGPQFADLATPQVEAAEAWRETLDYQKAALDFSKVMQDAWARAFENYSADFSLEDLQAGSGSDALKAWLKAANESLLETQRAPEFMDAQKRLLRASVEIKARQRETAEEWCEVYQMPTRTEVDDMAKILHELRREIRKLRREVASLKAEKTS